MILEAAVAFLLPRSRQWHYLESSKEPTHLQDYRVALNPLQNNPTQSSINQTKLHSFLSNFTGFGFAFQQKIVDFLFLPYGPYQKQIPTSAPAGAPKY